MESSVCTVTLAPQRSRELSRQTEEAARTRAEMEERRLREMQQVPTIMAVLPACAGTRRLAVSEAPAAPRFRPLLNALVQLGGAVLLHDFACALRELVIL